MNRLVGAALACLGAWPAMAGETPACPDLGGAERLAVAMAQGMNSVEARFQLYERGEAGWKAVGKARPAALGAKGMAWSAAQRGGGEPVKTEGDKRSPAGFFPLGKPFGFSSGPAGYVRLAAGEQYCVDDPASPHYNAVIRKAEADGASGEDMGAVPLYREGLFVDYPTNAAAKAGSCIFIHTWRSRNSGTAGCVALAEADVRELQQWSAQGRAMLAILPESAWKTLRACFPGL